MDLFVPILYDYSAPRWRDPFREVFEPFERAMTPWFHTPRIFDPFDTIAVSTPWTRTVGSHDQSNNDDATQGDTWKTSLSLEGFDRDNVKVTALDDHSVMVEAKKVNVDEEGGQYEYQHLCRKLAVPENVDMKSLRVDLSDNGEMMLMAGRPQLTDNTDKDTSEAQAKAEPPKPAAETGDKNAVATRTEHPVSNLAKDDKDFNVQFNLKSYPKDSIKVKVSGNRLSVQAKQEKQTDHGMVYRQFHQAMTIPRHVNPDDIQTSLSPDGILSITGKKREEREVEVRMEKEK